MTKTQTQALSRLHSIEAARHKETAASVPDVIKALFKLYDIKVGKPVKLEQLLLYPTPSPFGASSGFVKMGKDFKSMDDSVTVVENSKRGIRIATRFSSKAFIELEFLEGWEFIVVHIYTVHSGSNAPSVFDVVKRSLKL